MDSIELERASLEKRDRDQLVAIATAMGKKPPSRARKAAIVDLILELAGVPVAGGEEPDAPAEAPAAKEAAPTRASTSTAARAPRRAAQARPSKSASAAGSARAGRRDTKADSDAADGDETDNQPDADQNESGATESETVERPRRERRPRASSARAGSDRAGAERPEGRRDRSATNRSEETSARGAKVPSTEASAGDDDGESGHDDVSPEAGDGSTARGRNRASRDRAVGRSDSSVDGRNGRSDTAKEATSEANEARSASGTRGEPADQPENDTGNRRRRRRGRDRNRADEPFTGEAAPVEGLVDLRDEGYAFLRVNGHLPSRDDVYVPVKQVRTLELRRGDVVVGTSRPAGRNEKNPALYEVVSVNGLEPDQTKGRAHFDDLTAVFPDELLLLGTEDLGARAVDLLAPMGRGQRGLIRSPYGAGKTELVKRLAASIESANPEVEVIVVLLDERPEEVTDLRRSLERSALAASPFDRPSEEHTQMVELTLERAKRRVEAGVDVVILADGLSRLAHAYNQVAAAGGRGHLLDPVAVHLTKRFFGAARKAEEGGSLTILATVSCGTGSALDDAILDVFAGTANAELCLDGDLAARGVYPALDVARCHTRQLEVLVGEERAGVLGALRSQLLAERTDGSAPIEDLLARLARFETNEALLENLAGQ